MRRDDGEPVVVRPTGVRPPPLYSLTHPAPPYGSEGAVRLLLAAHLASASARAGRGGMRPLGFVQEGAVDVMQPLLSAAVQKPTAVRASLAPEVEAIAAAKAELAK